MLAKVYSYGLIGLNGFLVTVEASIMNGIGNYQTVGLPDTAVKESKERIHAAIRQSGMSYPVANIIVNLAPAICVVLSAIPLLWYDINGKEKMDAITRPKNTQPMKE